MNKVCTFLIGPMWCLAVCVPADAGTIYVDAGSTCTGTCGIQGQADCGGTWGDTTACPALQPAIDAAASGAHEVWVRQGIYGPISLQSGVKVYGGFAGGETSASDSDPDTHRTYLSKGGIRPVTGVGNTSSTILRGFYISGGELGLDDYLTLGIGSGMYLEDCDALFVQCVFEDNDAGLLAGAVAISGGSPIFVNCRFARNGNGYSCGAFYSSDGSNATFVNCLFHDHVVYDGAVGCNLDPVTFINCTFANNTASLRGGVLSDYFGTAVFHNCILWGNTAPAAGTEQMSNVRGVTTITYSNVEGGWEGDGNIGDNPLEDDPQFAYASGDNYRLLSSTPDECRDSGDETVLPLDVGDLDWDGDTTETLPLDLGLRPRIQGSAVGMGAYEYDGRPFYGDFTRKNRYITLVPDSPSTRMALRITLLHSELFPSLDGDQWWIDTPYDVADGGGTATIAQLRCNPVYVDWTGLNAVHIGDREIVPNARYQVEAAALGADLCVPASFSPPVLLDTSGVWGDIVGPFIDGAWPPSDGQVDQADVDAVWEKYQGLSTAPPLVSCDVDPNVPNNLVDAMDAMRVGDSEADPSHTYPFTGPVSCACPSNCCDYGKCCRFRGACSNTLEADCTGFGSTWTAGAACEGESNPCGGGGPPPGGN